MVQIVCQVVDNKDRVSFTWSEGAGSFEPYYLERQSLNIFRESAKDARLCLRNLVADCRNGSTSDRRNSSLRLAQAGNRLYRQIFYPGADQREKAKLVHKWLNELNEQGAIESLEIVVDPPTFIPWNVIYETQPDEHLFLTTDSQKIWEPFWGLRYNLAGTRRVSPLRRKPILKDPKVLLIIDSKIQDGLPEEGKVRLSEFTRSRNIEIVRTKEELAKAIKSQPPDFMYWLCHASPEALVLGDEDISPTALLEMLQSVDIEANHSFGSIAFLNACQTAEGDTEQGSFIDALSDFGFSGSIVTEERTIDRFANTFGLDFMEAFLENEEPIGSALRRLRGQVPLGLLYATYCPPHIRVRRSSERPAPHLNITVVDSEAVGGNTLSSTTTDVAAAIAVVAVTELPLPDNPYPSLSYYDRGHRALFAGRDADIHRFAELLDHRGTHIVVLHGESGVGKSSFLRAGVVPYLEEECIGYQVLRNRTADKREGDETTDPLLFVRATNDLFGQVAQALIDCCAKPYVYARPIGGMVEIDLRAILAEHVKKDDFDVTTLRAALQNDLGLLGRLLAAIGNQLPFGPVLVIDQAEEVFTLAKSEDDIERRQQSLEMLRQVVAVPGDFKIIVSLRTEYYGRLIDRLRRGQANAEGVREYLLTDFSLDALIEAIERPTSIEPIQYSTEIPHNKYKFTFADGVAEEIASTALNFGTSRFDSVLPLIQVVCAQLYEKVQQREDRTITSADIKQIGGIQGGMLTHTTALVAKLFPSRSDQKAFKKLLTDLYIRQPDESLTTALLREDKVKEKWTGSILFEEMLRLTTPPDVRLLRTSLLTIGDHSETRYVSLGHDALAKVAAQWDNDLSANARTRRVAVVLGIAALITLTMLFFFLRAQRATRQAEEQKKNAEYERQQGRARRLAAEGLTVSKEQPDVGLIMLVEAFNLADDPLKQSRELQSALFSALEDEPRLKGSLRGHVGLTTDVAFSLDNQMLASAGDDKSIVFWDVATYQQIGPPLDSKLKVLKLAFVGDKNTLATVNEDNTLTVWDVAKREPLKNSWRIGPPPKPASEDDAFVAKIPANAFSADGKLLAVVADGDIKIFDTLTGEVRRNLGGPKIEGIRNLTFSPDGRILAFGAYEGFFFLWDWNAKRLKPIPSKYSHLIMDSIAAFAFTQDGKLMAVSTFGGNVRFFHPVTGTKVGTDLQTNSSSVTGFSFSGDGKTLLTGNYWDGTVRLFDVKSGKEIQSPLKTHTQSVFSIKKSADGKTLVTIGRDQSVFLWDLARHPRLGTVLSQGSNTPLPSTERWPAVVSPDRKLLGIVLHQTRIGIWDITNFKLLKAINVESGVDSLAFSPDGKKLAAGIYGGGLVIVWNTDDWTQTRAVPPFTNSSSTEHKVAFSHDGHILASTSETEQIALWNATNLQLIGTIPYNPESGKTGSSIQALSFSSDNTSIITASDDYVVTWSLSSRQKTSEAFPEVFGLFPNVVASPDGKFLVGGSENLIRFWDVLSQTQSGSTIQGHSSHEFSFVFSLTGLLASGGDDGSINLWSVASQQRVLPTLSAHSAAITSLAFSPDAKMLFSTDKTETTIMWDLDLQSWLHQACGVANRNLTPDEWKRYIGDEIPYHKTCRP